ncbi:bifunctional epoxide hydrolase 2-like [Olea europaea subsp. europaea]|uniref:Bifunctional epoxide hydrolase 2-like n=1 Tax=Olea europaea subsp. europaea TaxID=158383 RepID=A0A8S0RLE0_OLEEU|nr:bifunctional epoxide hydrolase 2-like [Olea europaea subsp. europaea]
MEKIEHKIIPVNGLNMHVAELGEGPLVLLLHGFPELWYSWRHQILYLAAQGYRDSRRPVSDGDGETVSSPRMLSSLSLLQFFWRLLLLSAGCAAYCRVTYWLLPSSLFAARLHRTAGCRSTVRRPSPQKAPSLCNYVWLCIPQIRFFAICLLVDKLLILFV